MESLQAWPRAKRYQKWVSDLHDAVVRSFLMNHIIYHRAILCVYLRLNNIPVPGLYGLSGDD